MREIISLIKLQREIHKLHPKLHIDILNKHWHTTPLWFLSGLFWNTDFAKISPSELYNGKS